MQNKFLELAKKNNKKIILSFLSILLISFLIVTINSLFRLNKIEKQTFSQMPSEKQDDYLQLQDTLALLEPEEDYVEGQVIAKFDETYLDLDKRFSLDNLRKDLLLKNIKLELNNQFEKSNQVVLESKTKSAKEIIDVIYFYPYIKYVELNQVLEIVPLGPPTDGCYTKETMNEDLVNRKAIPYSRYENYWNDLIVSDNGFSGKVVKVGIVDSAVEKNTKRKPTLGDMALGNFSNNGQAILFFKNLSNNHFANKTGEIISKENLPYDDYANHGTSVAGVVEEMSQRYNNKLEIVSLFHEDHKTDSVSLVSALENAENNGVRVFNLSFAIKKNFSESPNFFRSLSEYIKNSESLFVWALSNDGEDYGENSKYYSECLKNKEISNLICVGSENNGAMTLFSSYTTSLKQNKNFIYAPGQEMYLPVTGYYCPEGGSVDEVCAYLQKKHFGKVDENNNLEKDVKDRQRSYPATYCRRSGNSFAAPYIAGLAGLVMSQSNLDASATKALIFDNSKQTLAQKDENIFQFGSINEVAKKKVDFKAVLKAAQDKDELEKAKNKAETIKETTDKEEKDETSETSPSGNATPTEKTSDSTDTTSSDEYEDENELITSDPNQEASRGSLVGQSCQAEEGKIYLDNIITKCSDNGRQALVCENGEWKIDRYCGADQTCQEIKRWKMGFLGIGSHDEYHYVCAPENLDCYGGFICDSSYYLDENNQKIPSNEVFRCDSGLGKSQKWNTWEKQPYKLACSADKRCVNEFDENYEPKSYSCENFATLCLNSGGVWSGEQCDCSNNFSYDELSKQCLPPDLKYRCTSDYNDNLNYFFLEKGKFYDGPILSQSGSENKDNYMYLWNKTEYGFFQSESSCQKSADCFNDQENQEEYCHEMTKCLLSSGQWKDLFGQQKCFCNNQELKKQQNGFYEPCVEGYGAGNQERDLCEKTGGDWNNNQKECKCDAGKGLESDGKNGCKCSDDGKDYDGSQDECIENPKKQTATSPSGGGNGNDEGNDGVDGSDKGSDVGSESDEGGSDVNNDSIPSLCINFDARRGNLCAPGGYASGHSDCCSGNLNSPEYHYCDNNGNYLTRSNTLECKQAFCQAQNEGENDVDSEQDCVDGDWDNDSKKCTYESGNERWEWKNNQCVDNQSKEVKEEKEKKEECEKTGGDWKKVDDQFKCVCNLAKGLVSEFNNPVCKCQDSWKKLDDGKCVDIPDDGLDNDQKCAKTGGDMTNNGCSCPSSNGLHGVDNDGDGKDDVCECVEINKDWNEATRKCEKIDDKKLEEIKNLCKSTGGKLASWDESLCVCQNYARWEEYKGCQCDQGYIKQDDNTCIKEENDDDCQGYGKEIVDDGTCVCQDEYIKIENDSNEFKCVKDETHQACVKEGNGEWSFDNNVCKCGGDKPLWLKNKDTGKFECTKKIWTDWFDQEARCKKSGGDWTISNNGKDVEYCDCGENATWKGLLGWSKCKCDDGFKRGDDGLSCELSEEESDDAENSTQEETTEDSLKVGEKCDWQGSLKCNKDQNKVLECRNGEITVQKACSEPNPICLQQGILAICTSQDVADQINEEETEQDSLNDEVQKDEESVEIGEDCSWEYRKCNKNGNVVSCKNNQVVEAEECDQNSPCQSYYYAKTGKYLAGCGFEGPLPGIDYSCDNDRCLEIGGWWHLLECEDGKVKDTSSLYKTEEECEEVINDESNSGNDRDDEDGNNNDNEGSGGGDDDENDDNKVDFGGECQKNDDCVDTALCINEVCREKCGIGGNVNKSNVKFSSGNTNGTSYDPDSAYFASNQVQVKGFSGRVKAPTNPSTKQPFSCSQAGESCSYYLEVCLPDNSKEMCLAYNSAKDINKDKVEKEKAEGKQGSRTYDDDKCVCNGDWQLTDRGECVAKPLFCSEKNKGTKLEEIWNATYQRCVNKGANLPDSKKDEKKEEEKTDCYFLDKENCSMKDKDGKEVPILKIANEMCALECKNFKPRDEDDVDSMNSQWGNVDKECYLHQRNFPKSISPKDSGRIINCNGFGKVGDSTLMSRCGAIFSGDCRNNYKPYQDTGACCEVE